MIDFELRPTLDELLVPTDDSDEARVWREIAREAIGQLSRLLTQHERLRQDVRLLLGELQEARKAKAA